MNVNDDLSPIPPISGGAIPQEAIGKDAAGREVIHHHSAGEITAIATGALQNSQISAEEVTARVKQYNEDRPIMMALIAIRIRDGAKDPDTKSAVTFFRDREQREINKQADNKKWDNRIDPLLDLMKNSEINPEKVDQDDCMRYLHLITDQDLKQLKKDVDDFKLTQKPNFNPENVSQYILDRKDEIRKLLTKDKTVDVAQDTLPPLPATAPPPVNIEEPSLPESVRTTLIDKFLDFPEDVQNQVIEEMSAGDNSLKIPQGSLAEKREYFMNKIDLSNVKDDVLVDIGELGKLYARSSEEFESKMEAATRKFLEFPELVQEQVIKEMENDGNPLRIPKGSYNEKRNYLFGELPIRQIGLANLEKMVKLGEIASITSLKVVEKSTVDPKLLESIKKGKESLIENFNCQITVVDGEKVKIHDLPERKLLQHRILKEMLKEKFGVKSDAETNFFKERLLEEVQKDNPDPDAFVTMHTLNQRVSKYMEEHMTEMISTSAKKPFNLEAAKTEWANLQDQVIKEIFQKRNGQASVKDVARFREAMGLDSSLLKEFDDAMQERLQKDGLQMTRSGQLITIKEKSGKEIYFGNLIISTITKLEDCEPALEAFNIEVDEWTGDADDLLKRISQAQKKPNENELMQLRSECETFIDRYFSRLERFVKLQSDVDKLTKNVENQTIDNLEEKIIDSLDNLDQIVVVLQARKQSLSETINKLNE